MQKRIDSNSGFTLVETMIAMFVLTVGVVGMASMFLHGMAATTSAPNELIATQKAAEAIESVFAARDSRTVTWAQLRNVADGGVFIGGQTNMYRAGADGILNTADDSATGIESFQLPGPDGTFGTGDDTSQSLIGFKREIRITNETSVTLRKITVTITYPAGATQKTFTVTALISQFA